MKTYHIQIKEYLTHYSCGIHAEDEHNHYYCDIDIYRAQFDKKPTKKQVREKAIEEFEKALQR